MNRKWLAAFSLVVGIGFGALGDQFIFQAVPANVVSQFNSNRLSYYAVANSGTNFYCVGSNSVASLAGTNLAPPSGGYLTNVTTWGRQGGASHQFEFVFGDLWGQPVFSGRCRHRNLYQCRWRVGQFRQGDYERECGCGWGEL